VFAPSVLTHGIFGIERDVTGFKLLQHDQHRHQLRNRGRRNGRVEILAREDRAARAVHDRHMLRRRGLRRRSAAALGVRWRGQGDDRCERECAESA
jgi:hypothetical protein